MKNVELSINLTPELVAEAQRRLDFIIDEGSKVYGIDETIDVSIKPDWYNEERFKRGQQLLQKHFTAYVYGGVDLIRLDNQSDLETICF